MKNSLDYAGCNAMRMGNCNATETDVNDGFPISPSFGHEIEELLRGFPIQLWVIEEPALSKKSLRFIWHLEKKTHYPDTIVVSGQSKGFGTTAYA